MTEKLLETYISHIVVFRVAKTQAKMYHGVRRILNHRDRSLIVGVKCLVFSWKPVFIDEGSRIHKMNQRPSQEKLQS